MYENICTLPLSADLFTQAIHPTKPLFAVGLSTGHVQLFRLPPVDSDDGASEAAEKGYGEIETAWRTRRHKGSCRSLGFSLDGESIYSAGTDAIIKVANMENGRVFGKIAVPLDPETSDLDPPSLLHVLSPQTFLIGTDSSALHLYDTRINHTFTSSKPEATHRPHDDYISSLTPLPPSSESTSGFSKQWVTTGGTTLAVTDLRRGVLHRSEDQEEELLSTTIITGLAKKGTSTGEKVLVGGASGVVTLWERGVWDDQDERIVLDRTPGGGESVDCLVDVPGEKTVVAGMGDGSIGFVRIGSNQVVEVLRHDEVEGVVGLGFDAGGRLISGGGQIVKVWREGMEVDDDGDEDEGDEFVGNGKRKVDSDSDSDESESESEQEEKPKRKKRKGKGKSGVNGVKNGIALFKGLD